MDDPGDNFPYDNVEFPPRKPVTPGPAMPPSPRIHFHTQEKSSPSLAPVIEMRGLELDDSSMAAKSQSGGMAGSSAYSSNRQFSTMQTTSTSSNFANKSSANTADGPPLIGTSMSSSSYSMQSGAPQPNLHAVPPTQANTQQQVGLLQTSSSGQSGTLTGNAVHSTDKQGTMGRTEHKVIIKQPESLTWPFEKNDFNSQSQAVLNQAYLDQSTYNKLYSTVIEQGHALQKPLHENQSKLRDKLSYEQLLQGMLFDGERLLLSGHWIYFSRVEYFNDKHDEQTRAPLGSGRACLTNKRLLLMVADNNTDALLSTFGNPKTLPGGYKLSLTQKDDVAYQSIPLHCFRSVEMGISVGSQTGTKITGSDSCGGMCGCLGVKRSWKSSPPVTTSINRRTISLGLQMPPWNVNTLLVIHIHPDLPLTLARDFVGYVQTYAPQLH